MAHKLLKGRKKPKSAVKQSLKASLRNKKTPKPLYKNAKERALAEAAAAKAAEEEAARAAAAAAAVEESKAQRRKRRADSADAAAPPVAKAPAPAAEPAEAPESAAAAEPPRKLSKKEQRALAAQEKQHLGLYTEDDRILLVGEGNFSFARALCRRLNRGSGVFATAFDNEATLKTKYTDAAECRKEIEEQFSGTTLVGVDATRIHKVKEFRNAFNKVVWNFPHTGSGEKDSEKNMAEHRELLSKFFTSAVQCLNPEGPSAIHVALKVGEPYKSWKVVQVARAACPELDLLTAVPFALSAWPGYAHRRTAGFDERLSKADSEELAKGAKVYVFVRRRGS